MTLEHVQSGAKIAAPAVRRTRRRPLILGELVVVLVLLKVYDLVRGFAHLHEQGALHHALDIVSVERLLHLDVERGVNAWLAVHASLSAASAYWYQFTHVGVTLAVLAGCYAFAPQVYRSARNALVLTNVAGLIVYLVLPVMPPRLLPYPGFVDVLARAGFDNASMSRITEDQYGAMPSLHMAWATWVAIMLFVMLRRFRWRPLVVVYPAITALVVIGTANHYVLDVAAGVAVAVAAAAATGLFAHSRGLATYSRTHD